MEEVLKKAVPLWAQNAVEFHLVAHRENYVYKISQDDNTVFALKIHRKGYRKREELLSELKWLSILSKSTLQVPQPIVSRNGLMLEEVEDYQVSALKWLKGKPMGKSTQKLEISNHLPLFKKIGKKMAVLHQVSDRWTLPEGFTRPSWNLDNLIGNQPLWGRFWENPELTNTQKRHIEEVRFFLKNKLEKKVNQLDYGLIHADLVRENIMIDNNEIQILDFDDGGFGYRLFELATTLIKNRREANYDEIRKKLIEGYTSVRPLHLDYLDDFILIRSFTYLGWIIPRLNETGGIKRCQRYIKTTMELLEDFRIKNKNYPL